MLVAQIIEPVFPQLSVLDKVTFALHLMEDYDVLHLPVIAEEKFAGLISKDDLLDAEQTAMLASLQHQFIDASVLPEEHFLTALKLASHFDISLIPAVNKDSEIQGIVTQKNLIRSLAGFFCVEEPGGMVVLEMDKRNFSFGELSRLVETNDASITQLNTYTESTTGLFIVTFKINKIEISDIIATLQRYDYSIRYYFGEEDYENELKENYDLLMTYLNI
ncbi:MAG: CBS domain-containing protein [Ginsengibacter sp.]